VVPDKEAVKMIAEKIKKTEAESGFSAECGTLYVTGGTASGAFRLCGLSGSGEAAELTVDDLKKLLGDAQKDPETYEKTVREIMPERFDSIFSGIAAYIAVCELSGVKTVVLSKTTCRYGYAAEIYEKMFRR
jgi:exopolyphosphatase/pppGpp-phosphohydrolase